MDLCKESFELLELGQGFLLSQDIRSPIHGIAEKGLTSYLFTAMRLFQPPSSIVNAFVVKDSSPNANLKFRVYEVEWINNLFLKGPSGGTLRFINSITELYPAPNEAVLKKVDLCKESFELLELGQGRGSTRNLSPIHGIAEKGLTSIHRYASISAGVLHALAGGETVTVTAVSALFQLVGAMAFTSSHYHRRSGLRRLL